MWMVWGFLAEVWGTWFCFYSLFAFCSVDGDGFVFFGTAFGVGFGGRLATDSDGFT